jgi:uncharacterized protein (TIGR02996 family)
MDSAERSFWTRIDQEPTDIHARLVFADWLQDADDPRAEGLRALVANGWEPGNFRSGVAWGRESNPNASFWRQEMTDEVPTLLPDDWWKALHAPSEWYGWWRFYLSRSDALNAAAEAFSRLPVERRNQLLQEVCT